MRKAALYIQGRIVLGGSHLDAYEQLSENEKDSLDLISGFFNEETKEFTGYAEEEHFFQKEIILIRHGQVDYTDNPDPDMSSEGYAQVKSTCRILQDINLKDFKGLCSPTLRCLRTAQIITDLTGILFQIEPQVIESPPFLKYGDSHYISAKQNIFPIHKWPQEKGWVVQYENNSQFQQRIERVLRNLPPKTVIVSHSGFVINLVRMALCDNIANKCGIPTASLTHIVNREVKCLGRNL